MLNNINKTMRRLAFLIALLALCAFSPHRFAGGSVNSGPGWIAVIDDEFNCANNMVVCTQTQTPTSITWDNSNSGLGEGVVVLPAASNVTGVGQIISLFGFTNSGSGGSAAINITSAVVAYTDSQHFKIWLPASTGVFGTIGTSGAELGSGAWYGTFSGGGGPIEWCNCMGNGDTEGWNPANLTVGASGLSIALVDAAWTDPLDNAHTYNYGHIDQSAYPAATTTEPFAIDTYAQFPYGQGFHTTFWALGSNSPDEFDPAEGYGLGDPVTPMHGNIHNSSGFSTYMSSTLYSDFLTAFHQYTGIQTATSTTSYIDGTQEGTTISNQPNPTSVWYPLYDVTSDSLSGAPDFACSGGSPCHTLLRYYRIYKFVNSCSRYATIPSHSTSIVLGPTC
jgi:hypothetical protein